jgi:hypothetical protein
VIDMPAQDKIQASINFGGGIHGAYSTIKNRQSIVGHARQNMFEFPVFCSDNLSLDTTTAAVSLLEQVYGSFLQIAISTNPMISPDAFHKGQQFANFKTDTNRYLEYTAGEGMDYTIDACHFKTDSSLMVEFAKFCDEPIPDIPKYSLEFNMITLEDNRDFGLIQEAMDYVPLSEFPSIRKRQEEFYMIREWDDEDKDDEESADFRRLQHAARTSLKPADQATGIAAAQAREKMKADAKRDADNAEARKAAYELDVQKMHSGREIEIAKLQAAAASKKEDRDTATAADNILTLVDNRRGWLDHVKSRKEGDDEKITLPLGPGETDQTRSKKEWTKHLGELVDQYSNSKTYFDALKAKGDAEKADWGATESIEKIMASRQKRAEDSKVKASEVLKDSDMQKLNTMKPLMLKVEMREEADEQGTKVPHEFIIGVKCRCRLFPGSMMPEVAEYPLKEMNKIARKARWRAGELKFFKDIVFRIKQRKQTAIDSRDSKRKWFRRLYELAHTKGDAVSANIFAFKKPDLLQGELPSISETGGVIPNCSMIITKSDVDNVKRTSNIDLLDPKIAAQFCKDLFLIGFIVIDIDRESVKVLLPDMHGDFEVHSMASINKQLATLDTVGTKTKDMLKLFA